MFTGTGTPDEKSVMTVLDDLGLLNTAALVLVLQGKFDERIAQLKQAKAELEEKQAIALTLAEAQKIRDDAQALAQDAAAKSVALDADKQALAAKVAEADKASALLDGREAALKQAQAALQASTDEAAAMNAKAMASLADRENDLSQKRSALAADARELEDAKEAFNAKLAALRA